MTGWDEEGAYGGGPSHEGGLEDENRHTPRLLVIRAVALVLLFSLLGSSFIMLRGIQHISIVVGILGIAALVGILVKKQRESENPYRSDDPTDFEIH